MLDNLIFFFYGFGIGFGAAGLLIDWGFRRDRKKSERLKSSSMA